MRLAFLIQCHKNAEQINCLLGVLKNDNVDFYIHLDKKSNIENQIQKREDIYFLSECERVDVKWGTFSQVQATLNLLNKAISVKKYDYYFLISGQDFPIQPIDNLLSYLSDNRNCNFLNLFPSLNNGLQRQNNYDKRNQIVFCEWLLKRTFLIRVIRRLWVSVTGGYNRTFNLFKRENNLKVKFYFGSSWWCLNSVFVCYLKKYLTETPQYIEFFKKASCPDESFFQTLLMNSPFADTRRDYLHYIDWSEGKSSPKNLSMDDLPLILESNKFMARKIDGDFELINKLKENLNRG